MKLTFLFNRSILKSILSYILLIKIIYFDVNDTSDYR